MELGKWNARELIRLRGMHEMSKTVEEVMNSDLVRIHGVENSLWILANANERAGVLLKTRKDCIELLEAELREIKRK